VTGPPPTPPPKWKTAIVTLVAVFPPVLFFNVTVIPFLGGISVVLRTLALCVGVTAAVTWVMMPRLMPLAKNWLNASRSGAAETGTTGRGSSRSRRRRRGGDEDEEAMPAWLLDPVDPAPVERVAEPDTWYEPREPAPRRPTRPAQHWDDEPAYPQGTRRAPWYGRQQPWYGRPQEDDYPTEEYRRNDYREDDYYEEPARYGRYDEPEWTPARDRGPGTGRYRR
jgi:hypothetical protein